MAGVMTWSSEPSARTIWISDPFGPATATASSVPSGDQLAWETLLPEATWTAFDPSGFMTQALRGPSAGGKMVTASSAPSGDHDTNQAPPGGVGITIFPVPSGPEVKSWEPSA